MKGFFILMALCFLVPARGMAAAEKETPDYERAIVTIEVTRRQYDYIQPWTRHVDQVQKTGTITGPREILTTAEHLGDRTLIRLQKGGRGKWWTGQVKWIDYPANLALITCSDDAFWKGVQELPLAEHPPLHGEALIMHWRNGNLDIRRSEINRLIVKKSKLSFLEYMHAELESESTGLGWGEAVISDNKLIGIACSKEEHTCTVIPSSFARFCVESASKGVFKGLGFFNFVWERTQNTATVEHLQLPGEPRGVVIVDVMPYPQEEKPVRPLDI